MKVINIKAIVKNRVSISLLSFFMLLVGCESDQRLEQSRLDDFGRFGRSVDISIFTAVVGAYQESNGAAEGAAYVYTRRDNTWSIQARLESPTPGDEQFGDAVAVSGSIIAVGAPLDNQPGAFRSGSVYLYQRDADNNWSHLQTLSSPLPHEAWEAFGISVSLDGDILVVGAVDRDQGAATNAGAAFVYERNGGVFSLSGNLAAPSPNASDKFGSRVEVAGNTIAVSAVRRDSPNGDDIGTVFVYERNRGGFSLAQTLVASDAAEDDIFGTGIALFENNDGSRRLVIGAESADVGANNNAGAAYVFDAPVAGGFVQTAKLVASDGAPNDIFGTDVALWNDTILVGASGSDDVIAGSGAAYIFQLEAGIWVEEDKLTVLASSQNAFMGSAVDIWGAGHVLLGATGEEIGTSLTDTGAVQAFRRNSGGDWLPSHTLAAAGFNSPDTYGRTMAMTNTHLIASGFDRADIYRLDLDGYSLEQSLSAIASSQIFAASIDETTAAVFGKRVGGGAIGYVEVFTNTSGEWVQEQLFDPDLVSTAFPNESANSGVIDIEGDTLVIGARRWNGGDGRVFIYERDNGIWAQQQMFTSPQAIGNFDMNYGNAIALDGDWLAVAEVPSSGIPSSPRNGNVFIYQRINGEFIEQQILSEAVPSPLDHYGQSIALHDDLLAVYGPNTGTVYVYRRINGIYTEVWSQVISAGSLALTSDQLVIGVPSTDIDGVVGVGEVVTFDRQPDDSYIAGDTFQAPDNESGLGLGRTIVTDDNRIVVSTGTGTGGQRAYVFNF